MNRRNFLVSFLFWILSFFFGYNLGLSKQVNEFTIDLDNKNQENGVDIVKYSTGVYVEDFKANVLEIDDTGRIQRAINATNNLTAKEVIFAGIKYNISSEIKLLENLILRGQGQNQTIINSSHIGFAFEFITPPGSTERQAPHFENMRIEANSAIKFNEVNKGFSDLENPQEYLMRPLISKCDIVAKVPGLGIGIQWSKAFDGHIEYSQIKDFNTLIELHGSDICSIRHNRLRNGKTQIKLTSYESFGTHTLIFHNDMLNPSHGGIFIDSSDRSLRVEQNYMERQSFQGELLAVININGGQYASINDNRIEVPKERCLNWLIVDSKLAGLHVSNNYTVGEKMGEVKFSEEATQYYFNSEYRQLITHSGNSSEGFPFNSTVENELPLGTLFQCTPNTAGVETSDYGLSVKIKEGSFVLPPLNNFESTISLNSKISGKVDVFIIVKSSVDGQYLSFQMLNENTPIHTSELKLTKTFRWYKLINSTFVEELRIKFWNNDQVIKSDVYVKKVIVMQSDVIQDE